MQQTAPSSERRMNHSASGSRGLPHTPFSLCTMAFQPPHSMRRIASPPGVGTSSRKPQTPITGKRTVTDNAGKKKIRHLLQEDDLFPDIEEKKVQQLRNVNTVQSFLHSPLLWCLV